MGYLSDYTLVIRIHTYQLLLLSSIVFKGTLGTMQWLTLS